jgi:hypothetical protein
MPHHQYTPAKYALQQKVESFGNLLFQLEEARLTHIYRVVFLFCEYKNIRYVTGVTTPLGNILVNLYINSLKVRTAVDPNPC